MAIVWDQKVKVKWNGNNRKYYEAILDSNSNQKYHFTKQNEVFIVHIRDLRFGANADVKLVCDNCLQQYDGNYKNMRKTTRNNYCCKKCESEFKKGKNLNNVGVIKCVMPCEHCGKTIKRAKKRIEAYDHQFCSKDCSDKYSKGRPNYNLRNGHDINCYTCGNSFYLPKYRIIGSERHFCSDECHNEWRKTDEYKEVLGMNDRLKADKVKLNCSACGKEIYKLPSEIRDFKNQYCNNECRIIDFHKHNPNPKKDRVLVYCTQCGTPKHVHESVIKKNKWHFCSRECYWEFRSENLKGDKIHNYNSIDVPCDQCGDGVSVTPYDLENRKNHFCCPECYHQFRSIHYSGENHPQFGTKKTPEQIERMREITIRRLQNGEFPQTKTAIHKRINTILDELNISYKNEFSTRYYSIDIHLVDYDLFIEIMGDYWHANPLKYENLEDTNQMQRKDIKRDKSKLGFIKNHFHTIPLYLWESDINNNIDMCSELIKAFISNIGILANYQSYNYSLVDGRLKQSNNLLTHFERDQVVRQII